MQIKRDIKRVPVTTYDEVKVFTLELSADEVAALIAVLGSVAGNTSINNPRDVTDRIYGGLTEYIQYNGPEVNKYRRSIKSGMEVGT